MGIADEKNPEYRSVGEVGALLECEELLITSSRKGVSRLSLGRLGKGSTSLVLAGAGELMACCSN
jgi:hypothetical protein